MNGALHGQNIETQERNAVCEPIVSEPRKKRGGDGSQTESGAYHFGSDAAADMNRVVRRLNGTNCDISSEEAREIRENVVGFFRVLVEWDRNIAAARVIGAGRAHVD
jgi:hypothetical protein